MMLTMAFTVFGNTSSRLGMVALVTDDVWLGSTGSAEMVGMWIGSGDSMRPWIILGDRLLREEEEIDLEMDIRLAGERKYR